MANSNTTKMTKVQLKDLTFTWNHAFFIYKDEKKSSPTINMIMDSRGIQEKH